MKRVIVCFFSALFLLISFIYIAPFSGAKRSEVRSSQLDKHINNNGDTERIDYFDSNGKLTIAADTGYATKISTKTDKGILEHYYDENGEPIKRYSGYYVLLREHDEHGNDTRITYLDLMEEPCLIKEGYAIETRKYNDKNQIIAIRFFDTKGDPIYTPSYGYGYNVDYDENNDNTRVTFVDLYDNPMMTMLGYASIIRKYYQKDGSDKQRVVREFYYNVQGEPVALSLGQYGIQKELNMLGQGTEIIFLGAEGEPIVTNKGYTKVIRTFSADNNVATEQYYTLDGNPVSLSESQYGVKYENGQKVYLNRDGGKAISLRNLLYYHSRIVIPLAIAGVLLSAMISRKMNTVLFIIYLCVIIYFTLMFRDSNGEKKTELLWYYRKIFTNSVARSDIIKNIWLFIPLGAILYRLYPQKIVLFVTVVLSMIIEGIQYVTHTGYCELDDIISNSLGGIIGFESGCFMTNYLLQKKKQDNRKKLSKEGSAI